MSPLGGQRTAILASLLMMGLMPISNATPETDPEPRRMPPPPPVPCSPPKREPLPLTPEQIKAQAKRERKAKRDA